MQRLLTEQEYQALTPSSEVEARDKALAVARRMIVSDKQCFETHYCTDCPIGKLWALNDGKGSGDGYEEVNLICTTRKNWPK